MQVPQAQTTAVTLTGVPARLMAAVPSGQSVEAMVIRGGDNNRPATLQVGNQFVRADASRDLQPGQLVTLTRAAAGDPDSLQLRLNQPSSQGLRVNQQVPVEVIERLASQRLLVRPAMLSPAAGNLPAEIEVSTARLNSQPAVGERLTMTVAGTQPLAVTLSQQQPSRTELLQQIQRLLLPLTTAQPPVLDNVQAASNKNLPPAVQQPLQQLLQVVSNARQLNSEPSVRQALNNSGVFLENQLMRGADTRSDFKAALLRLATALTQQLQQPGNTNAAGRLPVEIRETLSQLFSQPQAAQRLTAQLGAGSAQSLTHLLIQLLGGQSSSAQSAQNAAAMQQASQTQTLRPDLLLMRDMLREVETTTARVQLNQLGMLRDPETPSQNPTWLLDVPLKDKQQLDWLQLRFEQRGGRQQTDADEQWQIDIRLDTHALGRVQAAVALTGEQVAVNVTAESAESAAVLQQALPLLNEKLAELDLQVTRLDCQQSAVIFDSPASWQRSSNSMVDITV